MTVNSQSLMKFVVVRLLTLFRSSSGVTAGSQQWEFRTVGNIVRNKLRDHLTAGLFSLSCKYLVVNWGDGYPLRFGIALP